MNNPEFVEIDNKKYKINTDYRIALKCDEVARDTTIGDYERSLAIIYLLYGDAGIMDKKNYAELLRLATKFLSCNQEEINEHEEIDMDFSQDIGFIKASFKSDYGIILDKENMHWWDFYMYLNGLTENCVLNRVRELRTYDTSTVKDDKERAKIQKAQKRVALKKKKVDILSEKQRKSVSTFYELTGIER